MYAKRNTAAHSRSFINSLTARYHFTRRNPLSPAIIKHTCSSRKVPDIFAPFEPHSHSLDSFKKSSQYQITRKCPVGDAIMHADRRTDMKLTSAFKDSANALNNSSVIQTFINPTKKVASNRNSLQDRI